MINKNVTNVLKQLNGITNTVVLKYPHTIVNSPAGDVVAWVDISKLDSDEFQDIGIYNLGEFLSSFKLFDERTVHIENNTIEITSNNKAISLLSTNINLLDEFNKDESVFTKTEEVPTVCSFILTDSDMSQIKQASGIFKDLSDISIKSQDHVVEMSLCASNNFNAKSNKFKINLAADCTKEFEVKIPTENFNYLPVGNYNIQVKYNSSRDAYRVILFSNDLDLKIILAVKK